MLSKTSVGMAQILSQALTSRGIELTAINDTPLEVLVELSTDTLKIQESAKALEGSFERAELSSALIEGAEDAAHTDQMSECTNMVVRVLSSTLDLTQNVVTPMIDRVVKAIGQTIEAQLSATASPLEIIQIRPDPIFNSVYLQESTQRYVNQTRQIPLRSLGVPATDIAERLMTGHAGMDEQLTAFLNRVGVAFAASVWDRLFNCAPSSSEEVFSRPGLNREAVLAYFFAAKAQVEIPSGLNMDLSAWRAYTSNILAAAGASIAASYADRTTQRKFGRLVLEYPMNDQPAGEVLVDGDKYVDWLTQGGTPELIFATVYGDRNFEPNRMIERSARLKAEWELIVGNFQSAMAFKRFDAMVAGMKSQVTTEINAIQDDELVGSRADYHDRLRERGTHAKARDLEDLWHFSRKAVCRVIYPQTDAEALLLAIDEQGKIHEGKPVRELALYATIELMARWTVDQMTATYHTP